MSHRSCFEYTGQTRLITKLEGTKCYQHYIDLPVSLFIYGATVVNIMHAGFIMYLNMMNTIFLPFSPYWRQED